MAERNINISITNKKATVIGTPVIVCGNSDYTATFTFDDEWNLTGPRTARFVYVKDGKVQHQDVVFSGNVVAVPILENVDFVDVGVFAGNLCTTTPARVRCKKSILCGSGAPKDPTPDVYDQIMELFNEMAEAGAFGATEAQAQQIAKNKSDIAQLATTKAEQSDVASLTSTVGQNAQDITKNAQDIAQLDAAKAEQTDVAALAARMDTFTKLEEGSTTGDAELADIHVGYDGTQYETAGAAVRGQASALAAKIEEEAGQLSSEIEEIYTISGFNKVKEIEKNKVWNVLNGVKENNSAVHSSKNLIEVNKLCLEVRQTGTLICFDTNENYIGCVTPLVQGDVKFAYLLEGTKYVGFNTEGETIEYRESDFVFPFKYEKVNYFYVNKVKHECVEAHEYLFDYSVCSLPIYGTIGLAVGCPFINEHIGDDGYVLFNKGLDNRVTSLTICQETETDRFFGRPLIPYENKKVCCYGTSITDITGTGKYPKFLKGFIGTNNFDVKGFGGGKYTDQIKNIILSDTELYDEVYLEGCANDWYYGSSLEDLRESLYEIMQNITPRCNTVFAVIDHSGRNANNIDDSANALNSLGMRSREYYLKFAEILSSYGAIVLDAGMVSGINEFKSEMYVDQIHHSNKGGKVFAKAVYDERQKYK